VAFLNDLYAAAARRRRRHYDRRPDLRRRLRRPVVSVGNLAVGGRAKTPTVARLARLLLEAGERPAILSRGYGRTSPEDGVVVVSAPGGIRADLARSGDEPLMLARQVPGACVLVSSDRYLAGVIAEHHLGATVHLLDDGFQHLQLDRDVDIVVVAAGDLSPGAQTLPFGRLREKADALFAADAVLALGEGVHLPDGFAAPVFTLRRSALRVAAGVPVDPPATVFAVAGIADPGRFVSELRDAGYVVAGTALFPDHHAFTRRDVGRIWSDAVSASAACVVTTEKDLVRLLPFRPFPLPVGYVPLTMEPEPLPEFRRWLEASLRAARDSIVD
jgi:tetraacyldisaccharide 4'-kinase